MDDDRVFLSFYVCNLTSIMSFVLFDLVFCVIGIFKGIYRMPGVTRLQQIQIMVFGIIYHSAITFCGVSLYIGVAD